MSTTELYSGYTADGKPSSRVLRPPGGGSSNIFGTEPTPQQQPRQEGRREQQQQPPSNPTQDAQQEYQKNKPKGRAEAPFASFAESGKTSQPTQFNKCDEESQNEADFRSYSVTAYREAIVQNEAIRQRARGQVQYNPITGEEYPANYGQQQNPEKKKEEETDPEEEKNDTQNVANSTPAGDAVKPASNPTSDFVKVRQPPGGKSSGLW
ncbi:jupiter microtubule associated homolog 1-like isoform X3 [Dreissena polymorpha]|uniref:jupiter microtubule associated homolog 1-like isoform X3 n=1 Tax=Dreissena polymorpha TaxID=45954 RepID=UPI00226499E8|nr:jupiter microtubule associated homolog 1-like isoform X3 [Dreissena polymorpha]